MRSALALATVAAILHGASTFAQERSGVPQFQVDASWPKPLPNRWILGQVSGIATDRYDRIWIVHRPASLTARERAAEKVPPEAKCCIAAPPVMVFDPSGNFLFSWGGAGAGYQWPESEHGIYVDANDFVWLAGNGKSDGQVLKFTMDGKFALQIGKQGAGNDSNSTERLGSPADVAVDVAAREVLRTASGRSTRKRRPTIRRSHRCRSSRTRCIASASRRPTAWCTCATAPTTACRSSARTAPSSRSTCSSVKRAATGRSTTWCSPPTASSASST
jgi:hypothetical protein